MTSRLGKVSKILFIISVNLFILNFGLYSQNNELKKHEIIEDFDYLIDIINKICPNLLIRENVTHTSYFEEFSKLKKEINNCASIDSCIYIYYKALSLTQDMHNQLLDDDILLKYACDDLIDKKICYPDYTPQNSFELLYIDGKYYSIGDYSKNNIVEIPSGTQILEVNNIDIDNYIKIYNILIDHSVKWDNYNNKYYTNRLYSPRYTMNADKFILTIDDNKIIKRKEIFSGSFTGWKSTDLFEHKVLYFNNLKTLYIRIPEMDYSKYTYYYEELKKVKRINIANVVIDIRNNGGGSDRLWFDILSLIIDHPIKLYSKIGFLNNSLSKSSVSKNLGMSLDTINTLPQENVYGREFFFIEDHDIINNSIESINYAGNIYILVDNRCFSSALAFSSICKQSDKLITVGQPSNMIGGRGVTPFYYTLPNSKLSFCISPALDLAYRKEAISFYDSTVEIPVKLSLNDFLIEREWVGERFGEEFLTKYDPVFRKVVLLK
jgi:hypothetical protein